ncbi:formate/nitrite transporter family protein [Paraburkholderia youngii]|uniref:formate/nitrite transporter family protein n=1 Tax=Paraburkholderia youngii TaxID=2782701 RepID=UPI003D1C13DA
MLESKRSSSGHGGISLTGAAGYCVGFIIVVLGRQQLFTESTLTVLLPVLTRRSLPVAAIALRLWVIILAANLAGTWIFAGIITMPTSFGQKLAPVLDQLSQAPRLDLCFHDHEGGSRGLANRADGLAAAEREIRRRADGRGPHVCCCSV